MLAFLFPGQGSQRPGMGAAWVDHPSWEIITEASASTGRDLSYLLTDANAEELTHTRNAQLSTFALSLMILDAIERVGIEPNLVAGHSLGEYSALAAAGALYFEEGVKLVSERGEAMQEAAEDQVGTMAAIIGLEDEEVDIACRRANGEVWVANFNAPGQVVIAGAPEAVDRAGEIAKEIGAKKVLRFPVGGAFHTPFMASARERLQKAINETNFREPEIPVYANVDARAHADADDWPDLLTAQLGSPVRFKQMITHMIEDGADTFVEVGAGGVLSGLIKRISSDVQILSVSQPDELDAFVEAVTKTPEVSEWRREHQGEHLYVFERLVVSPATGLFSPLEDGAIDPESPIEVGTLLGRVGETEVRSPFAGILMGTLAIAGERITSGQPIAWLRAQ